MVTLFVCGLALSYVGLFIMALVTILHPPAFRKESFDLRLSDGLHVKLVQARPSIVWHEPDAYFPIRTEIRQPVRIGYKIEQL